MKTLLLSGSLLVSASARAGCEQPYMGAEVVADLGTLAVSLRELDQEAFDSSAKRLEAGLECVRELLPPLVFASAYRYIGTNYYFQGDTLTAERWLRTALEIDPGFAWDINELDESHPIRGLMAKVRVANDAGPVELEGQVLSSPSGSSLFLDGRPLNRPAATTDRPHLLQVVAESDRSVRQVVLVEGNDLPERFLMSQKMAADEKKAVRVEEEDLFKVTTVHRVRPAAKTPLMIAGGATGLIAGGLYGFSKLYRSDFEAAQTTRSLEDAARMTNTMVVLSGVTLAAGLGLEFAGVRLGWTGTGVTIGRTL